MHHTIAQRTYHPIFVVVVILFFSGIPGVYPTSNYCERYQLDLKGSSSVKGVIKLNQSKLSFIRNTLPEILLFERERSSTFVPGTVEVPEKPGRFALALTRCMRDGVDLVCREDRDGVYWIGNRAQFIGKPIIMPDGSDDRIRRYHEAVAGDSTYFLKKNDNKPADAARHMLNFAGGFCVVRKKKCWAATKKFGAATVRTA